LGYSIIAIAIIDKSAKDVMGQAVKRAVMAILHVELFEYFWRAPENG